MATAADELDPNALITRADRALYAAKDAGRNVVRASEDGKLRRAS